MPPVLKIVLNVLDLKNLIAKVLLFISILECANNWALVDGKC